VALQPRDEPLLGVEGLSLMHEDFVLFPLRAGPGHRLPAEQPSKQASHSGESVSAGKRDFVVRVLADAGIRLGRR